MENWTVFPQHCSGQHPRANQHPLLSGMCSHLLTGVLVLLLPPLDGWSHGCERARPSYSELTAGLLLLYSGLTAPLSDHICDFLALRHGQQTTLLPALFSPGFALECTPQGGSGRLTLSPPSGLYPPALSSRRVS